MESKFEEVVKATIYNNLFPRELSRTDKRKMQILDAAIKTYSALGVDYISYEDIARTAKISRPLVQHHFPDKAVLFEVTIKFIRAQFQELAVNQMMKHNTVEQQVIEYIKASFLWLEKYPDHVRTWIFFFYACAEDKKLRALHSSLTSIGHQRIAALIEAGQSHGLYKKMDYFLAAKLIQRSITGALMELTTEEGPFGREEVEEQTLRNCLAIIRK